ncbi:autotransporter outer membrane beta-barrel domain-containing protein, partial [Ochrobactrum sp. GPK 3]
TTTRLEIGGVANIYQDLKSPADYITVSDEAGIGGRIKTGKIDRTWGELGLTTNYSWLNDKYAVYGKVSGAMGLENGKSYSVSSNLGFRVKW